MQPTTSWHVLNAGLSAVYVRLSRRLYVRLGLVFRRAFGGDFGSVESAISIHSAIRQRLRAIAESVGQRIDAGVGDLQHAAILLQREQHLATDVLDRSGGDIAADAQPRTVSAVAHLAQFVNRFIVGFADRKSTRLNSSHLGIS